MRRIIKTDMAPAAIGPYSQAVSAGGFLFISGQICLDPKTGDLVEGDITAQTRRVMDNLMAVVKAAGLGPEHVVKCTCFLKDMNDFSAFNEVYGAYLGEVAPARECVEVSRLPKDVRVEVSAVCVTDRD